ncbi:MAG: glycosyltransferase [Bacteroidota bacterium]|nr:glycosyltransferase [Bacteroidota bacterium]
MIILSISLLLLIPYIVLILYYRQGWISLKSYTPQRTNTLSTTFISVVIAARNEEKNISACIETILNQTYPANLFEIIIVDDHSTDATVEIIKSFNAPNIRIIKLDEIELGQKVNSYKKKAIEAAINISRGDLIITTDADCILKPGWLENMASFYEDRKVVFIAAPVVYNDPSPGDSIFTKFLKIFQSLDFITLQGISGASVHKKIHSMCNGANLAYEKKIFNEVEGFKGIDAIASGDDMLLMHKIEKKYPERIGYLKSTNVIAQTQPAETLKEFMNQRIRWASKADKYTDPKITAVLMLVYLLNGWIFFMSVYSFFSKSAFHIFLLLIISKTLVEIFFIFPVARFFNKQKLLRWFVPAQPFHIIYTLIAGWLGKFGNYSWKGRTVK